MSKQGRVVVFWNSVPHRRWWIKLRGTSTTYISSVNAINHIFFAISIRMGVNNHRAWWISIWSFDHILLPVNWLVNQARHSSSIWVISDIRSLGQGLIWFLGKIAKLACKSPLLSEKILKIVPNTRPLTIKRMHMQYTYIFSEFQNTCLKFSL